MSRYPSTPAAFQAYFPNPSPPSHVLATPASSWSHPQLQHLRVLQHPSSRLPPSLARHAPRALPSVLQTELTIFRGRSQRPNTELPALTRLHGFYSFLAGVMQRPPRAAEQPRDDRARQRNIVSRMDGFVSGDGLGLSSSPGSEHSGRSNESMGAEAMRDRVKDERVTVAMAGQFVNDVVIFGRMGMQAGRAGAVEYSAAGERVVVQGRGWRYVTIDDGGLVQRGWDAGDWCGEKRLVGVECKGRSEGGYAMEGCDEVGQHVAEMVGCVYKRLGTAELGEVDKMVVLFCFSQNLFAVKWVEFREDTLRGLFDEEEEPGPDERMGDDDDEMGLPEAEAGEGNIVDEEGQDDDEEEDLDDTFLHVYCSDVQDLATANGRIAAAQMILAVVGYCERGL